MIKLAIASDNKDKLESVTNHLNKCFDITLREDRFDNGLHSTVLTLEDCQGQEIEKMFELIELATGIDPRKYWDRKNRNTMKAKRAASYILRNRFGFTYEKTGKIMRLNHATIVIQLRKIKKKLNINKLVPLELAVSIVLRNLNE